jgi:hypothetical protein
MYVAPAITAVGNMNELRLGGQLRLVGQESDTADAS